jgi:DNA-binding transcriptional ArsR family regulator
MELTRFFFGPSSRARTPVIPSMALYAEIVASAGPRGCSSLVGISEKAVPQSTLSQHFMVLREAGLIHSERRGVEMQNSAARRSNGAFRD